MMTATRSKENNFCPATGRATLCGAALIAVFLSFSSMSFAQEATPPAATLSVKTVPEGTPENTIPAEAASADAASPVPASDGTANAVRKSVDNTVLLNIAEAKSRLRDATVLPEALKTLFFTAWQHALLQESKEGFNTRLPNPGEVGSSGGSNAPRDPGIRELSLGGISYGSGSKWTVWLNGVRITPDAIPEQVLDIKVSRAFIDLKWYDGYTNKIYPVRMRPHERFNLDSRIFLPGTPAGAF